MEQFPETAPKTRTKIETRQDYLLVNAGIITLTPQKEAKYAEVSHSDLDLAGDTLVLRGQHMHGGVNACLPLSFIQPGAGTAVPLVVMIIGL